LPVYRREAYVSGPEQVGTLQNRELEATVEAKLLKEQPLNRHLRRLPQTPQLQLTRPLQYLIRLPRGSLYSTCLLQSIVLRAVQFGLRMNR